MIDVRRLRFLASRLGYRLDATSRASGRSVEQNTDVDFMIIGAQKAATTSLHWIAMQHPNVVMPSEETRILEDPDYSRDGVRDFLTNNHFSTTNKLFGIKRPDYLGRPEVPARAAFHFPNAKLIVVLRHPIDRLISAYYYYMRIGLLPLLPLNTGIAMLLRGELAALNPRASDLISYSEYGKGLRSWLEYFPRDKLLILLQDDVAKDPVACAVRMFEFLGLDPGRATASPATRETPTIYDLRRLRYIRCLNRLYLRVGSDNKLHFEGGLVRRTIWLFGIALDKLVLRQVFRDVRDQLDPALRADLIRHLSEDVALVGKLLGRPIPQWHQ